MAPRTRRRRRSAARPIWARRDAGAWAIPKGLVEPDEDLEACARREFEEELGVKPEGALVPLGRIRQIGGKWVEAFALEGDLDAAAIVSNLFELEWPPKSGRLQTHPEIDRAAWFGLPESSRMTALSLRAGPRLDSRFLSSCVP